MALRVVDPLALPQGLEGSQEPVQPHVVPLASVVAGIAANAPLSGPVVLEQRLTPLAAGVDAVKKDFRVFLTLIWRHLLGCDPNPIQLDLAWWLQHGPDRSVIMAFRGFSKSWITGAYALWRLYVDPEEKVLVVSGSLTRAVATTNWCLQLILTMPLLAHLKPTPQQRQSSKAFDVGPCKPSQSPSFHALGIGGQIVGFRGTCIIPDDVETQTNTLTTASRDKIKDAVKEFDSVLVPVSEEAEGYKWGLRPCIKYLGTPHDEDSLYGELPKRGYTCRIWPGLFPDAEQIKRYVHKDQGQMLAPYILHHLKKDPALVGSSTMPMRFPDKDLAKRRLSLGNSEFALQFMLDFSLSDANKYPLKLKDLMVMTLDMRKGPERVAWTNDPQARQAHLPHMGFQGDYYHAAQVTEGTAHTPWTKVVGWIDPSGRGANETALSIVAELNGTLFFLKLYASKLGYSPETLRELAQACVAYRVHELFIEDNFGDGMFSTLFRPVLEKAWAEYNARVRESERGGTVIMEATSKNTMAKERRMLSIMEPVTQQHRLVVCTSVIEYDFKSVQQMEGEDTRHRYAIGHQYSRLTRERDCLVENDRLESLAGACSVFADLLGVDPIMMAQRSRSEREEEELMRLLGEDPLHQASEDEARARSTLPQQRH